jgi:hypothetical protein
VFGVAGGVTTGAGVPVPLRALVRPPILRLPTNGPIAVGLKATVTTQVTGARDEATRSGCGQAFCTTVKAPVTVASVGTTSGTAHTVGAIGSTAWQVAVSTNAFGALVVASC